MPTDTSERELERLICAGLAGHPCDPPAGYGVVGWSGGSFHDYDRDLDRAQAYSEEQVVRRYLGGKDRDRLDPILATCVPVYRSELDEDGQVEFKGRQGVRAHLRLPVVGVAVYQRGVGEAVDLPELPHPEAAGPEEEDLSKGILDAIDLERYRVGKQAMQRIMLPDEDAEIGPVPGDGGGHRAEPELDRLSNILRTFNELWGTKWDDKDRVEQIISQTVPERVKEDTAIRNARQNSNRQNSNRQNARIEHDKALLRVMTSVMNDDAKLFKKFMDEPDFQRWMTDVVSDLANEPPGTP